MSGSDIEKITQNISEQEKSQIFSSLNGMSSEDIKKKVETVDLNQVADIMRKMNLTDAAEKLDTMTSSDIINQLSKNPQVIEKLKKFLK